MRTKRSGGTRRSIKRRSVGVMKKGVKFFKKHEIGRKIMRYGPAVAAAGAVAAGIVGTAVTGTPVPLMAGMAASGAIKGLDETRRRTAAVMPRPKMIHRNDIASNVSSSPTGSRVGGMQPL